MVLILLLVTNGKSPIEKIDMVPRFDYRTQESFGWSYNFNNNLLIGREEPNAYLTKHTFYRTILMTLG